ncbi:MAG: YqgE/AlgH family protein [Planctomycetota bacterium]
MDAPEWLKGHLLVAAESLLDPNFSRTVILLLEHNEQGAVGLVLNRPTPKTIDDVWQEVFQESCACTAAIHLGGPVTGPLTAIHGHEELADAPILPGLYTTTDPEKLKELVEQENQPCKFFAGYAGWGPGQLEAELAEESWRVMPAKPEHLFVPGKDELWDTVLAEIVYSRILPTLHIKNPPNDPTVN